MACLPITDSASVGVPYYSQGGGGGGNVGSTINCDFIFVNSSIVTNALTANSSLQAPNVIGYTGTLSLTSGGSGFTTWSGNNGTYIQQNNEKVITINGSADSSWGTVNFTSVASVNMANNDLVVSSINGVQPGGAVPEDLTLNSLSTVNLNVSNKANIDTISVSSIALQGVWQVPLFQGGRFTMPNADSNVVETDVIFSGTDWFAWATYDGAVNSAVSSIGTSVLSRSTFALYAQGGLGVSWMAQGN